MDTAGSPDRHVVAIEDKVFEAAPDGSREESEQVQLGGFGLTGIQASHYPFGLLNRYKLLWPARW
jgi:hypothetical protein